MTVLTNKIAVATINTSAVIQPAKFATRELMCLPIKRGLFASRNIKIKITGSKIPFTVCDASKTVMIGKSGMNATAAPITIKPVYSP